MKHIKLFENYDRFYRELDFQQNLHWTSENKDLEPMSPYEIKYLLERFPQYEKMWVYKDSSPWAFTGYSVKKEVLKEPIYGINITNNIDLVVHISKHPDEYYHITLTTIEVQYTNYRCFVCDQFDGVKKLLEREIHQIN